MSGVGPGTLGRTLVLALALLLPACGGNGPAPVSPGPDGPGEEGEPGGETGIPALGADATLDLGSWNLEWFGDPGNGPSDEALQLARVAEVMAALDLDIWSVQEVTSPAHFEALLERLPGYDGFLAVSERVEGGADHYSDFGGNELKVGLVWRASAATVTGARVILTDRDWEFAGRPPVEVRLSVDLGGGAREFVVVLLHAKAGAGVDDWERRRAGSEALQAYLDERWPSALLVVAGDFNDDVDVSIVDGRESSYRNLVDDPDWIFLSAALSEAGEKSTVFYPDVIDHHLVSDELERLYLAGSVRAFRAEPWIEDYGESTSDHYPVVTRFGLGGGAP